MMARDLFPDLFAMPSAEKAIPGASNYSFEASNLIARCMKDTPLDRWAIAAQMSRLSGDDVSKNMLDAWASPGRPDHNMPFYRCPLFEEVVSTHELTNWLVEKRGGKAAYGRDALNARLGRMVSMKKQLDSQIRELQHVMGRSIDKEGMIP